MQEEILQILITFICQFSYESSPSLLFINSSIFFAPEVQFDFPKDSEHVTLNTPSGTLGIFTCFDIFSHDLAVVVVEAESVGSGQWLEHVLDGGSLDLTSQVSYSTLGSLSEL